MFTTPLVVGLPAIDNSLDELIKALYNYSPIGLIRVTDMAKVIGLALAWCVGSYECWMMMLGRRVIDVMKILRIIGLSMCITASGWICDALVAPGKSLEVVSKNEAKRLNALVAKKEMQVAKLQDKYYQKVRALQDSIESAKKIQELGKDANWMEKMSYSITNLGNTIDDFTKRAAIVTETKITEWANLIIRFIGEAIFQISYYALLVMQLVFLRLLVVFSPLMFALSIVPPWSNAWSQWISKYLSISLWGFVAYTFLAYVDAILLYTLGKDVLAYTTLINAKNIGSWDSIGTLGMQGIGSTCMYFVGMCVGAVLLKSVPEVCSWLIPGGVSSSSAGNAGSSVISSATTSTAAAVTTAATTAAVVNSVANTAGSVAYRAAGTMASAAGGVVGGAAQGKSVVGKVAHGVGGAVVGTGSSIGRQIADSSLGTFGNHIASNYNKGKSSATRKTDGSQNS